MKNILVLGSGRSGTSALMGTLANSGYYIGNDYLPKNFSNPKGFFEDYEVNTINEDILNLSIKSHSEPIRSFFFPSETFYRARWLARIKPSTRLVTSESIDARIQRILSNKPYCFKDPRFSYTLPIWLPYITPDTGFICVFREPYNTAHSIIKECRESPPLQKLKMNKAIAMEIWLHIYQNILHHHRNTNHNFNWLFIHYNQLFTVESLSLIEKFTGAKIDHSFPEKTINRTKQKEENLRGDFLSIYSTLCTLAGFNA